MNFHDLITVAATIVVSLGGGGAIVYWFASLIGKILADKYIEKVKQEFQQELESHKARLRKSEFLFQKEFEAASAFISLRLRLMPRYRFAEMIWDDACQEFAHSFGGVEKALDAYIATHGAALQIETLNLVDNAKTKASSGKFEVRSDDVSRDGIRYAGEVMNALEAIEIELYQAVWSQSGT